MSQEPQRKGALADLLEIERRLETERASAAAESERILEAARAEARAIREGGDDALDARIAALRASIERECEAAIRAVEERAVAEERRYREVDAATRRDLTRWLVARVFGSGSAA